MGENKPELNPEKQGSSMTRSNEIAYPTRIGDFFNKKAHFWENALIYDIRFPV